MKKLIKKGDIILLILFLAVVVLIVGTPVWSHTLLASDITEDDSDKNPVQYEVTVKTAGDLYGVYPLNENQEIEIVTEYGTNLLRIKDGTAMIAESDCKNQICVNTGAINTQGQMIVCLPHRLSVEITTQEETDSTYDAVSY